MLHLACLFLTYGLFKMKIFLFSLKYTHKYSESIQNLTQK